MKYYILILFLLILAGCSGGADAPDAFGTFEAREITVSAEVPGKILQLDIEEGQSLDSGIQAGLIDTIDWTLKIEQLSAQRSAIASRYPNVASQIAVQQQQLKNLETEKNRIEALYRDGAATRKQVDDINGSIDVLQKQILSVQTQNGSVGGELGSINAQLALMGENLSRCRIVNPIKGIVLVKYAEAGEVTAAGRSLYKLADLSSLYLRAYISGSQLTQVKLNDRVDVLVDGTDGVLETLEGEVTWVSSEAEFTPKVIQTREERVNLVYAIKVKVKNDGRLKIGMPGEIRFRKQ